jgi:hypothetical protein
MSGRLQRTLRRAFREIGSHYDDLAWWRSRYEHRVVAPVHKQLYGENGIRIVDQDWDNLLVLDACRADTFESVFELDRFDDYKQVQSAGGSTPEWVKNNFSDARFGDIVYVAGNPQVSKYAGNAFHKMIEVWDSAFDESHRTVLPESMADAAIDAAELYPNKRLIIHFMQPHTPFLDRESVFPDNHEVTRKLLDESNEELQTMAHAVGRETVRAAYRRTLEVSIDAINRTINSLNGKTVVTSDHGELFGERVPPLFTRLWGHKSGIRHPNLVYVPWAVIDGNRRRVVDEGVSTTDSNTEKIESQLELLGYK